MRKLFLVPRQYIFVVNQKTDLHEHLACENKKILTLMPLKSQVRLRLARVRFLTGHFAWIFNYFLQTIFLAKAVIWFISLTREFAATQTYGIKVVTRIVWLMAKSRQFLLWKNQKTVLHEHLACENKKILTLMTLKSQVHLRLARVRFLTGHFAWIFNYFFQTIFLAKAVIWLFRWQEKRICRYTRVRNKKSF